MLKLILWSVLQGGIWSALMCGPVFPAPDPTLAFYEGYGHYKMEGSFFVDADQKTIWDVLTDYKDIPRFVGSMKISRVESRSGNDLVLYQEPEGGFLFFTKRLHLTLNVHETPEQSIDFKDASFKDFKHYEGSWKIKPILGESFEVIYTLDAQQNFDAPAFLASDVVSGGARDLLRKVREEIMKRKKAAQKPVALATQLTPSAKTTPTPLTTKKDED
jgi:ribosome-associated toxin RatA of RatAB toxin-antitoxin module